MELVVFLFVAQRTLVLAWRKVPCQQAYLEHLAHPIRWHLGPCRSLCFHAPIISGSTDHTDFVGLPLVASEVSVYQSVKQADHCKHHRSCLQSESNSVSSYILVGLGSVFVDLLTNLVVWNQRRHLDCCFSEHQPLDLLESNCTAAKILLLAIGFLGFVHVRLPSFPCILFWMLLRLLWSCPRGMLTVVLQYLFLDDLATDSSLVANFVGLVVLMVVLQQPLELLLALATSVTFSFVTCMVIHALNLNLHTTQAPSRYHGDWS